MKSSWKVSKTPTLPGEYAYLVYRILDEEKTDHSGNREIYDVYDTRLEAMTIAADLNFKESFEEE